MSKKFLVDILAKAGLIVEGTTDLQGTATAITQSTSDNSTKLATTAFVKNQGYAADNLMVHLAGAETITGVKTFSPTVTASAGLGRSVFVDGTITASANNNTLVGLDIAPVFDASTFTGVNSYAVRISGTYANSSPSYIKLVNNGAGSLTGAAIEFPYGQRIVASFLSPLQGGNGFTFYDKASTTEGVGLNSALLQFSSTTPTIKGSGSNGTFTIAQESGTSSLILLKSGGSISFQTYISAAYTDVVRIFRLTGNVLLQNGGTFTDAGYRLDVNGTARLQGETRLTTLAGTGDRMVVANSSGVLSTQAIPSITGFVPYTGATGAVNLGAYDLTVQGIKIGLGGGSVSTNTALGVGALSATNNGVSSNNNIGIGVNALYSNTLGYWNIGIGNGALYANTNGSANIGIGYQALNSLNGGGANIAIGLYAGNAITTGQYNIVMGWQNSQLLTTGSRNTFIGLGSTTVSTGNANTIIGGFNSWSGPSSLSNNVILADGDGNIRFQWDGSNIKLNGNIIGSNAYSSTAFVPTARTITINGTAYDLSADRAWTIEGVGGSGTTNYMPKWTASGTLGDSLIYDNGTKIGIGTTSPTVKLHVVGDIYSTSGLYVQNTSETFIGSLNSMSGIYVNGTTSNTIISSGGGYTMTLTSGGNVGINATNPSFAAGKGLAISDASRSNLSLTDGTNALNIFQTGADAYFNMYSSGNIIFRTTTNNTERMRITSGGNVGIGTSSPTSILNISSSVNNVVTDVESQFRILNTYSGGVATIGFSANGSDGQHGRAGIVSGKDSGSVSGYLAFVTRVNSGAFGEAMRITSNGNVGIGTTSPSYKLSVVGPNGQNSISWTDNVNNTGYLGIRGSAAAIAADNNLVFETAGVEKMRVDTGGSVLINRSATPPSIYKLIVKTGTNANVGFGIQAGESSIEAFNDAVNANTPLRIYGSEISLLNGNVGIGSDSIVNGTRFGGGGQVNRLKVASGNYTCLEINGSTSGGSLQFTYGTDLPNQVAGLIGYNYASGYANEMWVVNNINGILGFATDNTERMRITSGGDLYLGTTSDGGKFVSVSDATNKVAIQGRTPNGTTAPIIQASSVSVGTTGWYAFVAQSGNGSSVTANTMFVYGNGNVVNLNNSYGALSDIKLKENITDASPKLNDLMKVKVRNYNLKGEETRQIGVIAQELEEVFPSMIEESYDRDLEGNILSTTTKGVKYSVFVPMLIKAIQELKAEIDTLKNK